MAFLRRVHEPTPSTPDDTAVEDTPASLGQRLRDLVRFINSNAGRLPVEAVVAALRVTDTLRTVIDTGEERPLDIHAIVSINGILTDYLPTTLRAFLSLDSTNSEAPGLAGRTPKASLIEQVEALWLAATDVLTATRAQDADALLAQGSFLRTKFTKSDLDL